MKFPVLRLLVILLLLSLTGMRAAEIRIDDATVKSAGRVPADCTAFLKPGALKGARIGIAREFFGRDAEIDAALEQNYEAMLHLACATIVAAQMGLFG